MSVEISPLPLISQLTDPSVRVDLNFIPIAHLEEKQYFRLLSLQLVTQIAKYCNIQHPLNLPIPENCRQFSRMLNCLARLDVAFFILHTEGWERLPEPRKQKFLALFQPSRNRRQPPEYKKKFQLMGFN